MRYDFTKIIDRHGKDAIAVDGLGKNPGFAPEPPKDGFDVIPMWVADMDFRVAEPILKRLHACVDHGIFGYSEAKDDYFQAVAGIGNILTGK